MRLTLDIWSGHVWLQTDCYPDERGSREQGCFKITDGKKYITNNFPLEEICRTWNALPVDIKNTTKLKPFKKLLTTHYLLKYDTICSNTNCYPCSQGS